MTVFSVLALLGIILAVTVLMKALYGSKDGPTPCTGCRACNGTGKCVMRRREAEKRAKTSGTKVNSRTEED